MVCLLLKRELTKGVYCSVDRATATRASISQHPRADRKHVSHNLHDDSYTPIKIILIKITVYIRVCLLVTVCVHVRACVLTRTCA